MSIINFLKLYTTFKTEYRIISDNFNGFEVQSRKWYYPFWVQCDYVNTHKSIEEAEAWILDYHKNKNVVKNLGLL